MEYNSAINCNKLLMHETTFINGIMLRVKEARHKWFHLYVIPKRQNCAVKQISECQEEGWGEMTHYRGVWGNFWSNEIHYILTVSGGILLSKFIELTYKRVTITIYKSYLNKSVIKKRRAKGAEKQEVQVGDLIYNICIFILARFSKELVQVYWTWTKMKN